MTNSNEKERKRKLEGVMDFITKTIFPNDDIKFETSDEWAYREASKTILYVEPELSTLTSRQVIGKVLHVISHALYTKSPSLEDLRRCPEPRRKVYQLFNILEDIRIEQKFIRNFPGAFDSFLYKFKKDDSLISGAVEQGLPLDQQFILSLVKASWGEKPQFLDKKVIAALQDVYPKVQDLVKLDSSDKLLQQLLTEIWPRYKQLIDEDDNQNGQSSNQPQDSDESGDNSQQSKNSMSSQSKKELDDLIKNSHDFEDVMKKMQDISSNMDDQDEKESFRADVDSQFDEKEQGDLNVDINDPVLGQQQKADPDYTPSEKKNSPSYEDMYHEIMGVLPYFKQKLVSIMKDNLYARYGGNFRTGKLNLKKLYRIPTHNPRVFTKPILRKNKDYAVSLLIDESGSMDYGDKIENAAKATVLFSEVLHAAHIPFEIRGFNSTDRCYKSFGENFGWKHRRAIENIIPNASGYGAGCTNDGFAIHKASKFINKFGTANTQRIIIVMTDGYPNPSGSSLEGENMVFAKHGKNSYYDFNLETEIANASQTALLIGVGIQIDSVLEYYKNNVVVDKVPELPSHILYQVKQHIKRG